MYNINVLYYNMYLYQCCIQDVFVLVRYVSFAFSFCHARTTASITYFMTPSFINSVSTCPISFDSAYNSVINYGDNSVST